MIGSESVSTTISSISGTREQGFQDMLKKRLARQQAIILAGHALAVVTHWNEGNEFGHEEQAEITISSHLQRER